MPKFNDSNTAFNLLLLIVFIVLGFIGIAHHELWLDESHHWLIARDSSSLGELRYNLRYDGHPILWNILLFVITRFTHNPLWMQILNVVIATAAIAVLLFCAPFTRLIKCLFVFGYFPIYEYSSISRNYAIILLLLFAAISIQKTDTLSVIFRALLLALLANTHLLGLILAVSLAASWLIEIIERKQYNYVPYYFAAILIVVGAGISVIQIIPPPDSPLVNHWPLGSVAIENIRRALSVPVKGFIPFPDITQYSYWNEYLLITLSRSLSAIISIVLIFWSLIVLGNNLRAFVFYFLTLSGMLFFFFIANIVAVRYFGILFIAFVGALWIADYPPAQKKSVKWLSWITLFNQKTFKPIFICILLIQVLSGIAAYSIDFVRPFSSSRSLANYIRQENLQDMPMLMENCRYASSVSYLQNTAYFLQQEKWGSFCQFHELSSPYPQRLLLERVAAFMESQKNDALFIHYERIDTALLKPYHLTFIKEFEPCVIEHENFKIYRVKAAAYSDRN